MSLLLFEFTENQLALLAHIERVEAAKKLEIQFTDPEQDQRNLRRSIFLDGNLEMIRFIQEFDAKLIAEREAEKATHLPSSDPTNPVNLNPRMDF
jgi:hypothetical protein